MVICRLEAALISNSVGGKLTRRTAWPARTVLKTINLCCVKPLRLGLVVGMMNILGYKTTYMKSLSMYQNIYVCIVFLCLDIHAGNWKSTYQNVSVFYYKTNIKILYSLWNFPNFITTSKHYFANQEYTINFDEKVLGRHWINTGTWTKMEQGCVLLSLAFLECLDILE